MDNEFVEVDFFERFPIKKIHINDWSVYEEQGYKLKAKDVLFEWKAHEFGGHYICYCPTCKGHKNKSDHPLLYVFERVVSHLPKYCDNCGQKLSYSALEMDFGRQLVDQETYQFSRADYSSLR